MTVEVFGALILGIAVLAVIGFVATKVKFLEEYQDVVKAIVILAMLFWIVQTFVPALRLP